MSATGGAAIAGGNRNQHLADNRFYSPPPLRKHKQKQKQQKSSLSKTSSENRPDSSSDCSISSRAISDNISNLDRFLEFITPHVPAQYLPKTSSRRWKTKEVEFVPYYVLGDLWEYFKEWSAYGAGVPLVLNGNETVKQYYNVSLSAIQLYIDPTKPSTPLRKSSQESDSDSTRETCSDCSSGHCHERGSKTVNCSRNHLNSLDACNHALERVTLSKPFTGSPSEEPESYNPPGQLIFQYFEHDTPYHREPLADKVSSLALPFPELKTYRSCDLSPASWVSLAWYPIYRIPTGPTLQSLSACFLTYHSLSTAVQSSNTEPLNVHYSKGRDISSKLSVPTFGLAHHKFKISIWDPDGVSECQKANSLARAAENWLRLLRVNHPDYNYFMSHYKYLR